MADFISNLTDTPAIESHPTSKEAFANVCSMYHLIHELTGTNTRYNLLNPEKRPIGIELDEQSMQAYLLNPNRSRVFLPNSNGTLTLEKVAELHQELQELNNSYKKNVKEMKGDEFQDFYSKMKKYGYSLIGREQSVPIDFSLELAYRYGGIFTRADCMERGSLLINPFTGDSGINYEVEIDLVKNTISLGLLSDPILFDSEHFIAVAGNNCTIQSTAKDENYIDVTIIKSAESISDLSIGIKDKNNGYYQLELKTLDNTFNNLELTFRPISEGIFNELHNIAIQNDGYEC